MAIGLFYESGGSATGGAANIHEISGQMSDRNATSNPSNSSNNLNTATTRPQTIIINDSESSDNEAPAPVLIKEESDSDDPIFNTQSTSNAASNATARRLADLFRPPHGIMFNGTFEMARRFARDQNRWLLVTVHAPTDFPSQAMNRDLWNSNLLQSFIKENFVFVQMIVGGSDERRYTSFYPFDDLYPHVALIDPRTGERVETLLIASIPVPGFRLVPTDRDMLEILGEFIAEHPMDVIGDRKRTSSSPKCEYDETEVTGVTGATGVPGVTETAEVAEPETKKPTKETVHSATTATTATTPATLATAAPMYDGNDAIVIQFRLPSGQKHRHRFNPRETSFSEIFQTASAVSSTPLGQFKLRTAEGELKEEDDEKEKEISKLHNTMLTIIK